MAAVPLIALYASVIYVTAGVVVGLLFVLFGVTRVLDHPAGVSPGARILLFPASAALWPLIVRRWLKSREHR
jgi:hypothetical protein